MHDIDPLMFYAMGIFWVGYGVYLWRKNQNADHWTSVPGVISESFISDSAMKFTRGLRFNLRYDYSVDNKTYTGTQLTFSDSMDYPKNNRSRQTLEKLVAEYPAGKTVEVYFNPDDPGKSFLTKGYGTVPYVCVFVGIIIIGYGLLK